MKVLEFTLAGALRAMLDESELGYDELAKRADVSKGSISNYVKGRTVPRWSTVARWAEACGYEPHDLQIYKLWRKANGRTPDGDPTDPLCAPWDLNPEPADYGCDTKSRVRTLQLVDLAVAS